VLRPFWSQDLLGSLALQFGSLRGAGSHEDLRDTWAS